MAMDFATIALSKVTTDEWREADYALALFQGDTQTVRLLDWLDMQGEDAKDYYHNCRRSFTTRKSVTLTHARFA